MFVFNGYFPDRKCYLFDTFEGFSKNDHEFEKERSLLDAENLRDTNVEDVMSIMPHKDMIYVKKGYFPQTAVGIEDTFCFVNLDMDLYKPILEGLRFFYPQMVLGGDSDP